MKSVLVIIPTYNERENISVLLPRIFQHTKDVSVLIIDDNSPDGTFLVAQQLTHDFPSLFVERRNEKSGLGSAYRYGFQWALDRNFDYVIEMDADLSHRVRDLNSIIQKLLDSDCDLVIGSRWINQGGIENWAWHRILLSQFGNRYVQFMLKLKVKDATSGLRGYSSRILRLVDIPRVVSEGYCFQIEMVRLVKNLEGIIEEIPITFRERVTGSSKMSSKIIIEALSRVTIWGVSSYLRGLIHKNQKI